MAEWSLDGAYIMAGGNRMQGFGETDALSYERVSDEWEVTDCCDGGTIHSRKLTRRGTVTLTLRYDSPSHRVLAELADAGDDFSFSAEFPNGRVVESGECRVLTRPKPTFGGKTSDEVWVLSAVPLEIEYEQGSGS